MKTSILIGGIVACALSAPILSAQGVSAPAKPAMGMDQNMTQMQESMKKMQGQLDRIRKTTDPTERRKLMQEHMQTMREGMRTMRGMGGPMMMGMAGGKSGTAGPGMMDADPKQRYPALIYVASRDELDVLYRHGIDIDHVAEAGEGVPGVLVASVYVNAGEASRLSSAGLIAIPVPNESLRAHRLYGPGSGAPIDWPTFGNM